MGFLGIGLGYFLQQFERQKWDWYRMTLASLTAVCGFPTDYRPQLITNRIFFTACLMGNMVYNTSVVVFFMRAMSTTMFYENQIETIQEIVNSSFDLKGDEFALQHLMKQKTVIAPLALVSNFIL